MDKLVKPSSDKQHKLTLLNKFCSDDELDALLLQRLVMLRSFYRGTEFTSEEMSMMVGKWAQIVQKHSLVAFDSALDLCIDECKFFPSVAEIYERIGRQGDAFHPSWNQEAWDAHRERVKQESQAPDAAEWEKNFRAECNRRFEALKGKVKAVTDLKRDIPSAYTPEQERGILAKYAEKK